MGAHNLDACVEYVSQRIYDDIIYAGTPGTRTEGYFHTHNVNVSLENRYACIFAHIVDKKKICLVIFQLSYDALNGQFVDNLRYYALQSKKKDSVNLAKLFS